MKLFIEVEISPDEIPLATELFRTLRTLTDHVKARDIGKLFHTLVSRLEDPNQLDSVAAEVATLLTEVASGPGAEMVFDDFLTSFMAVVFNRELVVRQQSVVPFMFLLPRLPEVPRTKMRDALIPKVLKHLTVKRPVEASRMDFFAHAEAFAALVNLEFVSITGAVTTIITLLRKQENRCAAITMLGKTVELCLQQLTEKCDPGTLQELAASLRNITEDVFQKAEVIRARRADVHAIVNSLKLKRLAPVVYDINYIEDTMGWNRALSGSLPLDQTGVDVKSSLSHSLLASSHGLKATESYLGHRNTIFAMSYDESRGRLVSGGKDGTLIVWGSDGQKMHRDCGIERESITYGSETVSITTGGSGRESVTYGSEREERECVQVTETVDMQRHYACSMDIHVNHHTLLVCGVAKEDAIGQGSGRVAALTPPCILCYAPVGHGWKEQGCVSKDSSKLVSCIKAMGQGSEHAFVTGETINTASGEGGAQRLDERLCYYDISSASNFANLQPLRQYAEHEDLITCVSLFPPNPNIFMSGSRDCTVRVWDRRTPSSVGMFGTLTKTGRVQAHDGMITCLDANDAGAILSAGMDTRVLRWDFRTLSTPGGSSPLSTIQLDDSAVLKVALGGSPGGAAVSTLRGLYMVDLGGPRPMATLADAFPDGRRIGRYHDLKWAHSRKTLFAAGDDMRVDVYAYK